jgi:hypothetical protein
MNREFLTIMAAMARKMGAPPFLQRVLTTFIVWTTLVVEGLAGIIQNPPIQRLWMEYRRISSEPRSKAESGSMVY